MFQSRALKSNEYRFQKNQETPMVRLVGTREIWNKELERSLCFGILTT